jgi:bla regulator protein blaR1
MIGAGASKTGTYALAHGNASMSKTVLLLALCLPIFAQTAPKMAFEAASIKPSDPAGFGTRIMLGGGPGGRYSANGITVRQLITQAFGLQDFQLTGGPGWITSDRFDIEATPGSGMSPTREQTQQMLQSLLEERFQLKVRRETKNLPAYNLVLAKGGSKMKLSADQTLPGPAGPPPAGPPPGGPPPSGAIRVDSGPSASIPRGMIRISPGGINGQAMEMTQFVNMLSRQVGRPVADNTGLSGLFDVELNWTPDRTPPQGGPPGFEPPPVDPNGPTIFTALQEQLGLKLETASQPGDIFTIEKIEKPSEN